MPNGEQPLANRAFNWGALEPYRPPAEILEERAPGALDRDNENLLLAMIHSGQKFAELGAEDRDRVNEIAGEEFLSPDFSLGELLALHDDSSNAYSVRFLDDCPPEPTRWLIGGVLPEESCLVLGAEEKTGKTWFALDMAICLATGQRLLDEYEPRVTGKTLVYSPEGGWASRKRRMWGLCWGRGLDPREVLCDLPVIEDRLDLATDESCERLRATIAEHKPALLIIDPFISAHLGMDENSSGDVQAVLNNVRDLLQENSGMSAILAHHLGKQHKDKSSFHGLRGSTALGAWADGLISLRRMDSSPDAVRKVSFEHRDALAPPPGFFQFEVGEGEAPGLQSFYLQPCEEPKKETTGGTKKDRELLQNILDFVSLTSGTKKRYAGAQKLKISSKKFNSYFDELERRGNVRLDGSGLMRICD